MNEAKGKRLVLHVGMGKTGSSALQVALARNRNKLARHSIDYPEHSSDTKALRGEVVSGNALDLVRYVAPRGQFDTAATPAAIETVYRRVASSAGTAVLYSSEFLYDFVSERLSEFVRTMQSGGVDVHVVIYVRDLAGHALSMYSQVVKRSMYTGSLEDFLKSGGSGPYYNPRLKGRLTSLRDIVGIDHTRVLHYDSEREHILQGFLTKGLGLTSFPTDEADKAQINRSLSAKEIAMMRRINSRIAGPVKAGRIARALISREPVDSTPVSMTEENIRFLEDKFQDSVNWVNSEFFDKPTLSIRGRAKGVSEIVGMDDFTPTEKFLLDCLADVVNAPR